MKVYGDLHSGNCYKVRLLLNMLGIEHEWEHVDVVKKETQTEAFLALNPNGKIPAVVLDDGETLTESNAILGYFADGTSMMPTDRLEKARVYEWLFFEQYSHEPYIAVARFIQRYLGMPADRKDEYDSLKQGGYKALEIMESAVSRSPWLAGERMTIADISLYAYTHVASEGGFDLAGFHGLNNWLARVQLQPGYIAMGE